MAGRGLSFGEKRLVTGARGKKVKRGKGEKAKRAKGRPNLFPRKTGRSSINPLKPYIVKSDHFELVILADSHLCHFPAQYLTVQAIIMCQKFSSAGDVARGYKNLSSLLPLLINRVHL
jgi:hypothetical protein